MQAEIRKISLSAIGALLLLNGTVRPSMTAMLLRLLSTSSVTRRKCSETRRCRYRQAKATELIRWISDPALERWTGSGRHAFHIVR